MSEAVFQFPDGLGGNETLDLNTSPFLTEVHRVLPARNQEVKVLQLTAL